MSNELKLPTSESEIPSILFFGVARGGSSICNAIIRQLALQAGMQDMDILGHYYKTGVSIGNIDTKVTDSLYTPTGIFYGPHREFPPKVLHFNLNPFTKILVVRDPRDCLVSHYFAMKNIHTKFEAGKSIDQMQKGREISQTIDEYVVDKADDYIKVFNKYIRFVRRNSDTYIYRYEDIIENTRSWLKDVCYISGIKLSDDKLLKVLQVADFNVKEEDEHSHKRQVKSGDHIRKLKKDTIDSLNNKMARQLNFFDYLKNIRRFDTTNQKGEAIVAGSSVSMEDLEVIQKMRKDIDTLLNANHNRIKEIQALQELKKNLTN